MMDFLIESWLDGKMTAAIFWVSAVLFIYIGWMLWNN
jgi:hypothetical protein